MGKLKIIEIVALILTAGLTALIIWYPRPEYRKDLTIIAFGDSLTRGYGIPPGKNFVTFLSEYVKIPIINAGVTGDTTAESLIRLQAEVLDKKPDVVMILLGGNDFLNGYSEEVIFANLKTIIQKIKKISAKIVLIGISDAALPKYEIAFQRLVSQEKINAYVPNILGGILSRKNLLFDEMHPNERGHEIIAKRILPALQKILLEIKK